MTTVLEKEQYTLIYNMSNTLLIPILYSIYRGHYFLTVAPSAVLITSKIYWCNPVYNSYRRYIDMLVVQLAVWYQILTARNAEYANIHSIFVVLGYLCYPMGYYVYNRGDWWMATYFHIALHMCANVGSVILYSGHI